MTPEMKAEIPAQPPKTGTITPLKMHKRGWEILARTSIGNNLLPVCAELLTNSTDSYARLMKAGKLAKSATKNVDIIYVPGEENKTEGFFSITDQAEGMTTKELEERVTQYGRSTAGQAPRGLFGFGLKDVMLSMKTAKILTVKEGKITEAQFFRGEGATEPYVNFTRKDVKITEDERRKVGIRKNGTRIVLMIPKEFQQPYFDSFIKLLDNFYPLRKILLDNSFKITMYDSAEKTAKSEQLKYLAPKSKEILKRDLTLKYKDFKFDVRLKVERAFENLTQHGWQREGGLLTFYGDYAVVGCSLFGYDYEPYARKFVGGVEIIGNFKDLLNQEPEILDFRRRGFNENHEFYDKFLQPLVQGELKKLIDKEIENARIAGETFSGKNIYEVMMQINKIAQTLLEGEPKAPAQFPVDYIAFYFRGQKKIEVAEGEWQGLSLAVNKKTVPNGSVIRIKSDNPKIFVTPAEIHVKHADSIAPDRINYRVYILAQKPGIIGKVDATVLQNKKTDIDVISNPNPKMHPKNGFAFYPEKETIPLNQTDKVSLIMDEDVKNSNPEILIFSSSNNIECVHHKMKIEGKSLKKISPYHKVYELKIPLIGKKLGIKSMVTAVAGSKQAKVQVEVVTILHKATHGLFKDLKIEEHRQVQDIAFERDGVLIVNKAHPVIRNYTMATNYMKAEKYQTLIANVFAELISHAIVDFKKKSGKLAFIDPTNPENVVDTLNLEFRDIYYNHGYKFVGMISKLLDKEWSGASSSSQASTEEE